MARLRIWRDNEQGIVLLDPSPTGGEEEDNLFRSPVYSPEDLNDVILQERLQDMGERVLFADRAFVITGLWVIYLMALPLLQMALSIWHHGLSNEQFIAVVTSTTVSIFGFWVIVARYLFPLREPPRRQTARPRVRSRRAPAAEEDGSA